jgi:muconolactone delta-isomerase
MEFLVTMTTHVPDGTPEDAVDDVRAREAAHSRELAGEGHLLRLWRPPLQPGEWRTLGLFAAASDDELEKVLVSMPLRVWRTDEVTPLATHPHDPGPRTVVRRAGQVEFLTTLIVTVPSGTAPEEVADVYDQEGIRLAELADQGHLLRLRRLPGEHRSLGHWQARDQDELNETFALLPLAPWLTFETLALSPHPNDPAGPAG